MVVVPIVMLAQVEVPVGNGGYGDGPVPVIMLLVSLVGYGLRGAPLLLNERDELGAVGAGDELFITGEAMPELTETGVYGGYGDGAVGAGAELFIVGEGMLELIETGVYGGYGVNPLGEVIVELVSYVPLLGAPVLLNPYPDGPVDNGTVLVKLETGDSEGPVERGILLVLLSDPGLLGAPELLNGG